MSRIGGTVIGVAAALVVALACASVASAATPLDRARLIANQMWGSPCAGAWTIEIQDLRAASVDETGLGGLGTPGECRIVLARGLLADSEETCTAVVHEVGHLVGAEHSDAPGSPMAPQLTAIPDVCRERVSAVQALRVGRRSAARATVQALRCERAALQEFVCRGLRSKRRGGGCYRFTVQWMRGAPGRIVSSLEWSEPSRISCSRYRPPSGP